jgi:hypothetical protein
LSRKPTKDTENHLSGKGKLIKWYHLKSLAQNLPEPPKAESDFPIKRLVAPPVSDPIRKQFQKDEPRRVSEKSS